MFRSPIIIVKPFIPKIQFVKLKTSMSWFYKILIIHDFLKPYVINSSNPCIKEFMYSSYASECKACSPKMKVFTSAMWLIRFEFQRWGATCRLILMRKLTERWCGLVLLNYERWHFICLFVYLIATWWQPKSLPNRHEICFKVSCTNIKLLTCQDLWNSRPLQER